MHNQIVGRDDMSMIINRQRLIIILIISMILNMHMQVTAEEIHSISIKEDQAKMGAGGLDKYISYALLNNPGLKASYEKWQAALKRVGPAKTLPDPELTFSGYLVEAKPGMDNENYSIGVSQRFPWFGKLKLMGDVALTEANSEWANYEANRLGLIAEIKKLYYELSYIASAIKITKDNITLLSNFENVARTKYKTGEGLQNAILKIQVELGRLEDDLASFKDSVRPLTVKLNRAMDLPPESPLPLPDRITETITDIKSDEMISTLKKENPDLKAMDSMAESYNNMVRLAEKNYYPDIMVGFDYTDMESPGNALTSEDNRDPLMASISINIPIWRNKYDDIKKENQAQYRSILHKRRDMENNLVADLEMALFELRDTERKQKLYRDTLLPTAEQNLYNTQLAFSADKTDFLDLIDAQRVLLEFQLAEEKAIIDMLKAHANIEMLTGKDMEREPK